MKSKRKTPRAPHYGAPVELSALPVDAAGGVWNTLAYAVDMASGTKLTATDFAEMVTNFDAYPKAPLVIEHADTRLFSPPEWAEPHGWITELRVGTYEREVGVTVASLEGKIQADAATQLAINGTKDAAGKVLEPPKWPFGSITVADRVDEETGETMGKCLWSFSLTAHPRLKDVPRLAASAQRAIEAGYWYGDIDDRDDLIECLRCIFDLPALAPEADVLAAFDRFEKLATGDEADAQGVDIESLVRSIRSAMRLPALTTIAEVIAEVRKGFALPSETQTESKSAEGMSLGVSGGKETKTMAIKFLMLAATLGFTAKTEDEAESAVVTMANEAADVRRALGTHTPAETAAKLSELSANAAKLPVVTTELDVYRKARDERVAKEREKHIDAVILTMGLEASVAAGVKSSFEHHAKTDWPGFQKAHPMPTAAELSARADDAKRLARVGGKRGGAAPADVGAGAQVSADDLIDGANALVEQYAQQGTRISFSEALEMLTTDLAPVSQNDSEPGEGGGAEPPDDE